MKNLTVLIITCVALAACSMSISGEQNTPAYPDLLITMERGPCYGPCPIYTLAILANGKVDYEGIGFVKVEGKRSAGINAEQIEELVAAIEAANFFSLEDKYHFAASDLPSITLTITLNGQSKSVWHYGLLDCSGRLDNAPPELCELESKIDEVTNSSRWVRKKN